MSYQNLEQKQDAIKALNENDVKQPNMPVDTFLQEGENLFHWCKKDKESLVNAGLDWSVVEDLPICLGALREAQSIWVTERNLIEEAEKQWADESPQAYNFRNNLLHAFRYAFRQRTDLLAKVAIIAEGNDNADMIQDLNDLAVLGTENSDLLSAINFKTAELNEAANKSEYLGELLAMVNGDRKEKSDAKETRDRAYILCKNIIDDIRACGKYLFWRNPDRLKGYISDYYKKLNS